MDNIAIIIPLLVMALAFWRRDIFLYIMGGIAGIELGIMWGITYWSPAHEPYALVLAIVIAGTGLYSIFLAIDNVLDNR